MGSQEERRVHHTAPATPLQPTGWQMSVIEQMPDDGTVALGSAKVTAVRSKTDEMKVYYIMDFGWIQVCTCKGFRYRTDCLHTREYAEGVDDA